MPKRNVPRTDFPHLKTGAGMFPEKPKGARPCVVCHNPRRDGPIVGKDGKWTLCRSHEGMNARYLRRYIEIQEPKNPPKRTRRRRASR